MTQGYDKVYVDDISMDDVREAISKRLENENSEEVRLSSHSMYSEIEPETITRWALMDYKDSELKNKGDGFYIQITGKIDGKTMPFFVPDVYVEDLPEVLNSLREHGSLLSYTIKTL